MNYATLLPSNKKIAVNNIFCLGKNYADHAKEMGGVVPSSPMIFLKPTSAIIENGADIIIPKISNNVHHEVELTVLIGTSGKNIVQTNAFEYVAGYGLGLDMTLRDLQGEAKKNGTPWSVAKGFDTSAALSPFIERTTISDPHNLDIVLRVNGTERQHSNTSHMMYKIDFTIAYLSTIFTLNEGDIIFTGTPEGVGQVVDGDVIDAELMAPYGAIASLQHKIKNATV